MANLTAMFAMNRTVYNNRSNGKDLSALNTPRKVSQTKVERNSTKARNIPLVPIASNNKSLASSRGSSINRRLSTSFNNNVMQMPHHRRSSKNKSVTDVKAWNSLTKSPNHLLEQQAADEYFGADTSKKPMKTFNKIKIQTNLSYKMSLNKRDAQRCLSNRSINAMEQLVSPRSTSKRIKVNGTFEQRMTVWSSQRELKLETERTKQFTKETEKITGMFKPKINERSKELAKNVKTSFQPKNTMQFTKINYMDANLTIKTRKKEMTSGCWNKNVLEIKGLLKAFEKMEAQI